MKAFIKKIDNWHLEILGIFVVSVILFPIIYIICRDGNGSAIFPMHDQLDESILNYVFTAKYWGASSYENIMCGIPSAGLKPFCPLFVFLYMIFDVYTAFEIQYVIVLLTAFYGMYFCIKKLTDSSIAAVIASTVFSFLPIHSLYGNIVMGTPLLIFSIMMMREKKKHCKVLGIIGVIYYGLSTSMVLSGWAAMGFVLLALIIVSVINKKADKWILIAFGILLVTYVVNNIDLFIELFSANSFVSHRVEFALNPDGTPFWEAFVGMLTKPSQVYEAETKHLFVTIPVAIAMVIMIFVKGTRKYTKIYVTVLASILILALLYALFGTGFVLRLKSKIPGMLSSFQFTRVYYFIPGMIYILLGISCAIIIKSIDNEYQIIAYILAVALAAPSLLYLVKDKDGIFYQNVNQINNGQSVTGYFTMRNMYADHMMTTIEEQIGKDMSTYRVVNIGISPVVTLMHGFYTLDGYSNNYPLEYKHEFREIIAEELELNDYNRAYFDLWGNRCYAFYHEWGNAYLLGESFNGQITDLHFNMDKLRAMNCQYIFSAGEICECQQYELSFVGNFTDDESRWEIWVYQVN